MRPIDTDSECHLAERRSNRPERPARPARPLSAPTAGTIRQSGGLLVARLDGLIREVRVASAVETVSKRRRLGRPGAGYAPMPAPSAPATVRALISDSSYSSAGSESATIAPPTCRYARPRVITAVRMTTARSHEPSGAEPAERAGVRAAAHRLELLDQLHRAHLRALPSSSRARTRRRRGRGRRCRERSRPGTVETSWCTVGCDSTGRATARDRPGHAHAAEVVAGEVDDHHVLGAVLRLRREVGRERRVATGSSPRGRVPLIGRVSQRPSALTRRNVSGVAPRAASRRHRDTGGRAPGQQRAAARRDPARRPGSLEPLRVVDLVDVAARDVVEHALDAGAVVRVRHPAQLVAGRSGHRTGARARGPRAASAARARRARRSTARRARGRMRTASRPRRAGSPAARDRRARAAGSARAPRTRS